LSEPIAFLLNLDVERELAGTPADPFRSIEDRPELRAALAPLVHRCRVIERDDARRRTLAGFVGRAWSPSPRALETLSACGATKPPAPSLEVLRRVNDKAFSAEALPEIDPSTAPRVARTIEEAREVFASAGGHLLLKRPFGFAGRGRLAAAPNDARLLAFTASSIERFGSVIIEPLLERTLDVALHGFIARDGELTLGEPTIADVDRGGVHHGSRRARADELVQAERSVLLDEGARVGEALAASGYFGPFGIDGFRFEDASGRLRFRPRCEINARYTMGWAVGMGDERPDLEAD
jgi:hypothetical protein